MKQKVLVAGVYLDLPLAYRRDGGDAAGGEGSALRNGADAEVASPSLTKPGPAVSLHAEFAGRTHTWRGFIVRTEGEIDAKSRMVNVVARVEDPYGRDTAGDITAVIAHTASIPSARKRIDS